MDALAGLLNEVRSSGALFGRTIMDSPWSVRVADSARLTLVTMVRGSGWIVPDGAEPVRINSRDVAIVVGPEPFSISDDAGAASLPRFIMYGPDHCTTATGEDLRDEFALGVRTCGDRLDSPNVLLTGTYQVRGQVSERLLTSLPRVLVVPDHGQPCPVMDLMVGEISRDQPGQQAILDRLLDLALLSTLREWFDLPEVSAPPWYAATSDPAVGAALRALHDEPARPWTVASLAREAGVSRATFARRFNELLGEPPMAYLTTWRLNLAADLLNRSDSTVESVARQVGYSSAYALSGAFKRHLGTRPSEHRALVSA